MRKLGFKVLAPERAGFKVIGSAPEQAGFKIIGSAPEQAGFKLIAPEQKAGFRLI